MNFIVNNAIRVATINESQTINVGDYEALIRDQYAYMAPYTLITSATCNDNVTARIYQSFYNGIVVGNVKHDSLKRYTMKSYDGSYLRRTNARNPDPVYGSRMCDTSAGDFELPHVVAPGYHPYTNRGDGRFTDPCLPSYDLVYQKLGGTSWSNPAVAGIAASVFIIRSEFSSWPELARVAIMLTAHNVDGGNWNRYEDGKDGTGVVSGHDATAWAQAAHFVEPTLGDNPPNQSATTGYYSGSWYGNDSQTRNFLIRIPATIPQGKHLRIVLNWDSRPDITAGTNNLSDLDLSFSGVNEINSSSWDASSEVIDVPNRTIVPGNVYQCKISLYTHRIPDNQFFYYA